MADGKPLLSALVTSKFPQWVIATHQYRGDDTLIIKREGLLEVARFLRDDPATEMSYLMDLSAVDYAGFGTAQTSEPKMMTPSPLPYFMRPKVLKETWSRQVGEAFRFEVVYHFQSLTHSHRLRLKVPVTEAEPVVDSLVSLWKTANWFEREVWEMFGITFTGHPNLKRLLMYEPFEGHPLRKDYPVTKRQPLLGPVN